MHFADPNLLNLLWGLLFVAAIMVYGALRRKKILELFVSSELLPVMAPKFNYQRSWIKISFTLSAFAFAIFALSGPQMGFKWQKTTQKGVDIMIALDCSKSMLAQDVKPNRLERAKREIIDLLHMMRSDRAGLVAFSGKAILQCPLTLDHETFHIFLKVLNPGFLPFGGTNLGEAINECYKGFEKESDTQKAIIIITDGESTLGDVEINAENMAKQMAKEGIKIFSISVGDIAGAPIPDEKGGFIKDSKGNIVLSKIDEKTLENIADLTGGIYVRSVAGDMDLDLIYKEKILGTMERKTLTSGKKRVWENRFQWFLLPSVILLLIELALSSKKRTHLKTNSTISVMSIFFIVFGMAGFYNPSHVQAKTIFSSVKEGIAAFEEQNYEQAKKYFIDAQLENPENKKLYYNIGTAAYMNKEYEQAQTNFKHALESDDKNLCHAARYNLANTHFRLGNLDDAIKEYENILKEFPEDTKAKENLEFVKKRKQEQQQQKSKSDKNSRDKDNPDKDNRANKDKNTPQNEQAKEQNQDQKREQDKKQNKDKEADSEQKSGNDKDQDNQQDQQQGSQDKQNPLEQELEQQQQVPDNRTADKDRAKPALDNSRLQQEQSPQQADRNMENMLNRLEDKPGRAMMPLFKKQHIEKDW